jgi:hypothetical protein
MAGAASAQPACGANRPWVALLPSRKLPRSIDRRAVEERLRVELAARRLDLCTGTPAPGARPPVATIALEAGAEADGDRVDLEIDVRDDVTSKRVGRGVQLASVPPDGRAAVVALAADELLRASWAELALEGARVSSRPAPPEVRAAVAPRASEPSDLVLGVRAAAEWWSAGLSLYGGDAALGWQVTPRLSLEILGGARAAPDVAAGSGDVSVMAASFRGGPRLAVTRPGGAAVFSLAARASGYWLRLSGEAHAGVEGRSTSAGAFALELAPRVDATVARGVEVTIEAGPALAVRGVEANDRGAAVSGVAGLAAMTAVGLVVGAP